MEKICMRVQYTEEIAREDEINLLNCLNLENFLPNIRT